MFLEEDDVVLEGRLWLFQEEDQVDAGDSGDNTDSQVPESKLDPKVQVCVLWSNSLAFCVCFLTPAYRSKR